MTVNIKDLEKRIEILRQESTACRSELCRSLESEADALRDEVESARIDGTISAKQDQVLSGKLREAYRNFTPDFRV